MFFLIVLIKSTALYGVFCLLVGLFGFHITIQDLLQVSFHPSGFKDFFMAYMFWSPALLIISSLVHLICRKISGLFTGVDDDGFIEGFMMRFVIAFTRPWTGLTALIGAEKVLDCFDLEGLLAWIEVILHFLWSVALLGFIGFGFFNLIK